MKGLIDPVLCCELITEMMIYFAGDERYRGPTLPPVYNTWLTFNPDWFSPPVTTTTTDIEADEEASTLNIHTLVSQT